MQRLISTLILLVCLSFLSASPAAAWLFGDDTLVSIDGKNYTTDDFKHWWKYWNDDNSPVPETAEPYIDWLLLAREGKRMELDSAPGFKRQTRVFLEARTLFMLKLDEVDSKVKVTDADVKARYQEKFQPRWGVERLAFKDEATAMEALKQLTEGTLKIDELEARKGEEDGPVAIRKDWLRPGRIDPGWLAIFKEMKVGDLVPPEKYGSGPILYYLKDRKEGDDEDLKKLSESIRKDLAAEQQRALTQELIEKLRDKYQVKVDEERLAALDIHGADESFTDDPVITSTKQNVSERQFMAVIKKVLRDRPTASTDAATAEGAAKLKADAVDNIIAQAVTNWECVDRHFEKKEPFKWEYEFNYNHRLGLALQQRLFTPAITVSDEDIKQEYEKSADRYTQPTLVKLYIVDETQGPIDKMWAEVASGKSFDAVVKDQFGVQAKPVKAPQNHLDPEVKPVVAKLAEGETSQIFKAQGIRVMAHLVERTPAQTLPLERVKESIRAALRKKKFKELRKDFLDKVKASSNIEIREGKWKAIQKELGGA